MKLMNKVWMFGFVAVLSLTLTGCGSTMMIELKKDVFVFEFGEEIKVDASIYVTAEKEISKKTVVEIKSKEDDVIAVDKDEETILLKVGTYKASATYKKEQLDFKIKVKDTTAPTFFDFKDRIEAEQGHTGNVIDLFKAKDFSKVEITIKGNVDLNVPGEYKIEVIATDAYRNKVTKKSVIVVKAKSENTESNEKTGTSSNPTGSTNYNGGSNHTGGSSGSNGSNGNTGEPSGGNTPTHPPADVCDQPIGNSGRWFDTYDEAYNYAYDVLNDFTQPYESFTAWGNEDCGWTVNFS